MKKTLLAIAVLGFAFQAYAIPRKTETKAEQILSASKERASESSSSDVMVAKTPAKVAPTKAEEVMKASAEERSGAVKVSTETKTKAEKALQKL